MPRVHRHRLVKKPSSFFFLSSRTSYLLSVLVSSATPKIGSWRASLICACFCAANELLLVLLPRAGSPRDGAGRRRHGGRRPDPSRGPPPGRRGRESRARSKHLGEHSIEKDDKGRGACHPHSNSLYLSLPLSASKATHRPLTRAFLVSWLRFSIALPLGRPGGGQRGPGEVQQVTGEHGQVGR